MDAAWDHQPSAGDLPEPTESALKRYDFTRRWDRPSGTDPYFRWARHTGWRSFANLCPPADRATGLDHIRIIAAAPHRQVLEHLLAPDAKTPLALAPAYRRAPLGATQPTLHFTATLPFTEAAQQWLLANPLGLRWRLALPQRDAERVADASMEGQYGPSRDPDTLRADNVVAREVARIKSPAEPAAMPGVLALIDFGCPFLNTRFADGGTGTRVEALWDQGGGLQGKTVPPGWPWTEPRSFAVQDDWKTLAQGAARPEAGRQLGPTVLDKITETARGPRGLDEGAVYRGIDHLIDYDDPRRRLRDYTHGGHLLDVLGGATDPLTGATGDPASQASLVFVQLPLPAAMDSTGGSLAPHLLDGVRYAMELCEPDRPLVVSISYGGQAGPHDGSSLIETALDELMEARPRGFGVVLAAGNARAARAHARRDVMRDRSALLRCRISASDTTDSFVEVWYAADPGQLEVRARTPSGAWSRWLGTSAKTGSEALFQGTRGDVVAMLRHDAQPSSGQRALALLALGPTQARQGDASDVCEAGEWQIELRLAATAEPGTRITIDAWIERDDPARGSPAVAPYFIDQLDGDALNTLSSIATGRWPLRAGGFNLGTGRMSAYSALGAPGSRLPQVLAACEQDAVSPSVLAAATRSGETMRMSGTSVAAPVLARRLYNAMVRRGLPESPQDLHALLKALMAEGDPCLTPVQEPD